MNTYDRENPSHPTYGEAARDAAIDRSLPRHDCGNTCPWCLDTTPIRVRDTSNDPF